MTARSLNITWQDPLASFAQARKFDKPIEYLRAIRDGRVPAPPIAKLLGMDLVEVAPLSARTPGGWERTREVSVRYLRATLKALTGGHWA